MIILDVVDEIRAALKTIAGLNVPPWGSDVARPPAALVVPPDEITFDYSYRRGRDTVPNLEVIIVVDYQDARSGFENIAGYLDGSGPKSIKALFAGKNAASSWVACEKVRCESVGVDLATYKGVAVVAATFHNSIFGKGTS